MRSGEALRDAWVDDQIHQVRVELFPPAFANYGERGLDASAPTVAAVVREGIKGVGDRDDPRFDWNLFAPQVTRVSCAVPPLVVGENAGGEIWIEGRERCEDLGAALRVRRNLAALFARQGLPVVNDVEERLMDFADVVKERDPLDRATLPIIQPDLIADDECVRGYAPNVQPGFLVVRLDGIEQRLERGRDDAFDQPSGFVLAVDENSGGEASSHG